MEEDPSTPQPTKALATTNTAPIVGEEYSNRKSANQIRNEVMLNQRFLSPTGHGQDANSVKLVMVTIPDRVGLIESQVQP